MFVRNWSARRLAGAGLLVCLACLAAAPPEAPPVRARQEDLSHWSSYFPLKLDRKPEPKAGKPAPLYDVVLTPAVFGASRDPHANPLQEDHLVKKAPSDRRDGRATDLRDLRLVDREGMFIPYDLRVLTPLDEQRPVPARIFDRVVNPDRSVQWSLDLGEAPGEYDRLKVDVPGNGFIRALSVEGSNDGKTWSKVLDNVHVVHLEEPGGNIDRHTYPLSATRFRYLRVQVRPDPVKEGDRPALQNVEVFRTVQAPGEDVSRDADLGWREPVRLYNQPASAWVIDLGADNVPCRRLFIQVAQGDFNRTVQVEYRTRKGYDHVPLKEPQLRPNRPGSGEAVIDFHHEVRARRLRLTVEDASNPPLTIEGVRYAAAVRQVVFAVPAEAKLPLRLYAGNPDAPPPNYEFATSLPPRLVAPPPTRVELGEREANPIYVPPPLPWTERWPYLVDAILAGACLVLLAILAVLARQAIRRHDATPQPS